MRIINDFMTILEDDEQDVGREEDYVRVKIVKQGFRRTIKMDVRGWNQQDIDRLYDKIDAIIENVSRGM